MKEEDGSAAGGPAAVAPLAVAATPPSKRKKGDSAAAGSRGRPSRDAPNLLRGGLLVLKNTDLDATRFWTASAWHNTSRNWLNYLKDVNGCIVAEKEAYILEDLRATERTAAAARKIIIAWHHSGHTDLKKKNSRNLHRGYPSHLLGRPSLRQPIPHLVPGADAFSRRPGGINPTTLLGEHGGRGGRDRRRRGGRGRALPVDERRRQGHQHHRAIVAPSCARGSRYVLHSYRQRRAADQQPYDQGPD
ncbi:hypothetical protein N9L68_08110 [bacterium]|nr:hypothetical protein [bacterium]